MGELSGQGVGEVEGIGRDGVPPEYIMVPTEMIYGDKRLPDELHSSYEVILGLAWRENYERTPAVSVAELAQLRGIAPRTMALHIAQLKQRGFLETCSQRAGQRQIYRLLVRVPARLPSEHPVTTAVRHPVHVHKTSDGPEQQEVDREEPLQPAAGVPPNSCNPLQGLGQSVVDDVDVLVQDLGQQQQQAFCSLVRIGVLKPTALELARSQDPRRVMDWVEYASRARNLRNPAGLVIAVLRRGTEPPRTPSREESGRRYISGPYAAFIEH